MIQTCFWKKSGAKDFSRPSLKGGRVFFFFFFADYFYLPTSSIMDAFVVSESRESFWCDWDCCFLETQNQSWQRTSLWAIDMAKYSCTFQANSWNGPATDMVLPWPVCHSYLKDCLYKKHSGKGDELKLHWKRQFDLTEENTYWL